VISHRRLADPKQDRKWDSDDRRRLGNKGAERSPRSSLRISSVRKFHDRLTICAAKGLPKKGLASAEFPPSLPPSQASSSGLQLPREQGDWLASCNRSHPFATLGVAGEIVEMTTLDHGSETNEPISARDSKSLSFAHSQAVFAEREPDGRGGSVASTTILLTASTCPLACRMCDLHRQTLPGPTPAGAIPGQIDRSLQGRPREGWLKLYNHGNFFDAQSIPVGDYADIARACQGYSRLIVENHPRFGSERLKRFRREWQFPLEVAVGLETVQPRWLDRIGKQMSRDEFDRYAKWLIDQGIDVRVFLIIGVPGITVEEAMRWTRLSVRHAAGVGARHISLIPARPGEGWSGLGDQLPRLTIESLNSLQRSALQDADGRACITIDLWDLEPQLPGVDDLQRRNLTQQLD
jgi:hypothetical protein